MTARAIPASIDDYIAGCAPAVQPMLQQIRATIAAAAPGASEKISYGIPTIHLHGNLVHFAAFANHVGLYPGASGIAAFAAELQGYRTSKGTVQLPLDAPLPLDLIARIVRHRVEENLKRRKPAVPRRNVKAAT